MMNNLDNDLSFSTFKITSKELSEKNGLSLEQIFDALQTSIDSGITGDEADIRRRQRAFGSNVVVFQHQPPPPRRSFHELVFDALRNSTFCLLLCCATLSLVIGIRSNGARQGFLDGAVFFLAIFLSLHFRAVFKVVKSRCRKRSLNKRRNAVNVNVIRRGETVKIPASEVVVGEVVRLERGDSETLIPADGILIGENTAVFCGEKHGDGLMVVTAVGKNTERQNLLGQSTKHSPECSKLEDEIEKISVVLQKTWLCLSLLILAVQATRCFVRKSWCERNPNPRKSLEEMMNEATRILGRRKGGGGESVNNYGLVAKLCVLLFALGDGLPLGIFVTLLYASKKMKKCYGATVRKLPACATLGLVTAICAAKTGDLALDPTSMADLRVGLEMEGPRAVKTGQLNEQINNDDDDICVLAESSPADQLLLIQRQRQKGEVVLSTGTSVRHLPSLQESDVGIFMGDDDDSNSFGESMKQDADISLKDVNFGRIFEILMFGRYVCRNIQKFIELQITLNVTAFTITFIVQISNNSTTEEPLTAFQLLWVSLIMDTLGALFLAKSTLEYPKKNPKIQGRIHDNDENPSKKDFAIITMNTLRNVAIQSLFQVSVLLTLISLNGKGIMVFHCYALLQVFVLMAKIIMAVDDENGGKSCWRLTLLLAFMVLLVFLSLQVVMSEIMAAIFHGQKMDFKQWAICVGISSFSIPIAYAANFIFAIKQVV